MILNLGDICSMATQYAGGRIDWSLSEASRYANMAYSEVATRINMHRPKEALAISSTTSGGNRIALPTDYDYSVAFTLYTSSVVTSVITIPNNPQQLPLGSIFTIVSNVVPIPLRQRDARWLDSQTLGDNNGNSGVNGIPEAYIPYGSWLELWPSPTSAYSILLRYMSKAPIMVASTDTPVLDERWHAAILYKTVELLEGSRNNVEGEMLARNRYLSYVASTPTDMALRQRDRTGMVLRTKWRGEEIID